MEFFVLKGGKYSLRYIFILSGMLYTSYIPKQLFPCFLFKQVKPSWGWIMVKEIIFLKDLIYQ
jgi:hypothetical protein